MASPTDGLRKEYIHALAGEVSRLWEEKKEVVLISSGAIAAGLHELGMKGRPRLLPDLQAAAAVGQARLASLYGEAFRRCGRSIAQVLLTHDDLADRTRYLNARATLEKLLDWKVVPIVNENDTVATEEIRFGDNDTLAALVTNLLMADALLILTDQEGLFEEDPKYAPGARLITQGTAGDPALERIAGASPNPLARGGMRTKVLAAKRAARSGAHTLILSGDPPARLGAVVRGETRAGTFLIAPDPPLAARKRWLLEQLRVLGELVADDGAQRAIREGASLLPVGVVMVRGDFPRGTLVAVVNEKGKEIARGLCNYSAEEARKILRLSTENLEVVLGVVPAHEIIHRDNLALV